MKEQEIIEDNKLIAEFMGAELWTFSNSKTGYSFWDKNGPGRIASFPDGYTNKMPDELKYHSSWDWLMPVVEKIESLRYDTRISGVTNNVGITYSCEINEYNSEEIAYNTGDNKMHVAYKTVVQFIKWYNNQPNQ